jgi:hypothetical protein
MFDNSYSAEVRPFFPGDVEITPAWANAKNKVQKWQELSTGDQYYSQSGTNIPTYTEGAGGAFAAGSDFPARGFGYQYQSPSAIAQGIPVGQDPRFPMSQEDFSEIVNQNLDARMRKPIMLSPELQKRIGVTRSRLGIGPI